MTPEERIRMLMEENAQLRAQLNEGRGYGPGPESDPRGYAAMLEAARRDQEQNGYLRKGTPEELAGHAAGMVPPEFYDTYKAPYQYIQEMPNRPIRDGGPYLKEMPNKYKPGNSPYLRKL